MVLFFYVWSYGDLYHFILDNSKLTYHYIPVKEQQRHKTTAP